MGYTPHPGGVVGGRHVRVASVRRLLPVHYSLLCTEEQALCRRHRMNSRTDVSSLAVPGSLNKLETSNRFISRGVSPRLLLLISCPSIPTRYTSQTGFSSMGSRAYRYGTREVRCAPALCIYIRSTAGLQSLHILLGVSLFAASNASSSRDVSQPGDVSQ